ncbi:helix-turn-helix transcriptional regulator [Streptomyces sp. NPDC048281]|uniref:helix-turn-helix domain-containing protein n=1 Tax=Streptomyces sp. NPDC048281 TaxID=3154715 RepID=UPI00342FD078
MCRPEKPITTRNKALRELAEWLREQRARTGQGYRALSVRAGFHATTLQRAASGEGMPKLQTVLGYARACDASPDEARLLWKQARYEQTRRARGGRGVPSPHPELIRDFVDMSAALHDLYEKAGSPPLRTMEQRAGHYGELPRSTLHRIVTKQAMPHNQRQFQAYLRACEVPVTDWPDWETAWTRAWRHEKQDDFAARRVVAAAHTLPRQGLDEEFEILTSEEFEANLERSIAYVGPGARTTVQVSRDRVQYDFFTGAHGDDVQHGVLRLPPTQVRRQARVSSGRRPHTGPARQRESESAVQGQLDFALEEPVQVQVRDPDALF